jgi:hypothetical protein
MAIDSTASKVYISSIDDELASYPSSDSDSDDKKLVFLPDIERRLTKIPRSVLLARPNDNCDDLREAARLQNSQLAIYNEAPASLTVPLENDNVRKAILESRARARAEARREAEQQRRTAFADLGNSRALSPSRPPAVVHNNVMPVFQRPTEEREGYYVSGVGVVSPQAEEVEGDDDDIDAMDLG